MTELTPGIDDTGRTEPFGVELHDASRTDTEFILEMARLACNFKKDLSEREAEIVAKILPTSEDIAIVARGLDGDSLGAIWTFFHHSPLLLDALDNPLPEMSMALKPSTRGVGISDILIEALIGQAKERFSALTINVDSRSPMARFYLTKDFKLAGPGRAYNDVAMRRELT